MAGRATGGRAGEPCDHSSLEKSSSPIASSRIIAAPIALPRRVDSHTPRVCPLGTSTCNVSKGRNSGRNPLYKMFYGRKEDKKRWKCSSRLKLKITNTQSRDNQIISAVPDSESQTSRSIICSRRYLEQSFPV